MERFDVIVIGGGPAGLMAASQAAEEGERVLVVEKNASLGVKLLMAGRGRCNFTNAGLPTPEGELDREAFIGRYGKNGRFLWSAFSRFGPGETLEFFRKNGVETVTERGGRIFPALGGGQRILDTLLFLCKKGGVRILRNSPVRGLKVKNGRIERLITEMEELEAGRCIVATGGRSYPKTGSTGDGYRFAEQAGHTIVTPTPALVPVKTKETWVKLAGGCNLRNVRVTVLSGGRKVDERFGEMEFTNFGVSGPVIMDMSGSFPDWMTPGPLELSIDLKPGLSRDELIRRLEGDLRKFDYLRFSGILRKLEPKPLIPMLLELSDVPEDKPAAYVSSEETEATADLLKDIRLTVNGLWSFNNAVVTRGGVALTEVDPATMRSKLCSNLSFAGEVLDLNGPSGGFNLQVCWSTGWAAGHDRAK